MANAFLPWNRHKGNRSLVGELETLECQKTIAYAWRGTIGGFPLLGYAGKSQTSVGAVLPPIEIKTNPIDFNSNDYFLFTEGITPWRSH